MAFFMRLQNLPITAQTRDIRHFFKDFLIPAGGIHIVGGKDDEAHITFAKEEDLLQALLLDKQPLCGAPVTLLLAQEKDKEKILVEQQGAPSHTLQTAKLPKSETFDVAHAHSGNGRKTSPARKVVEVCNMTTPSKVDEEIKTTEKDKPAKGIQITLSKKSKGEREMIYEAQSADKGDQGNESKNIKTQDTQVEQIDSIVIESDSSSSTSSDSASTTSSDSSTASQRSRSKEKERERRNTHEDKSDGRMSKDKKDTRRSKQRDRNHHGTLKKKTDRSRSKERDRKQRDKHKKKRERSRSKERDNKRRDKHKKRNRSRSKERDRKQHSAHKEKTKRSRSEGRDKKHEEKAETNRSKEEVKSNVSKSTIKDEDALKQTSRRSGSKEKEKSLPDIHDSGSNISSVRGKGEHDTPKEKTDQRSTEKDKQQAVDSNTEDKSHLGHAIVSKLVSSVTATDLRDYFRGYNVCDRSIIIKKSDHDPNTLIAGVTFMTIHDAMRAEERSEPLYGQVIDIRFVSERMYKKILTFNSGREEQELPGTSQPDTAGPASYWDKYRQHVPPGMWPWYYPQGPHQHVAAFPPGYPGLPGGPPPPGAHYAGQYYPHIPNTPTPVSSAPQIFPVQRYLQKTQEETSKMKIDNGSASIVSETKKSAAVHAGASLQIEGIPKPIHQSTRSTELPSVGKKAKLEFHIRIHNLKDHMCANVLWSILTSLGAPSKVVRLIRGPNGVIVYAYATSSERFPVDEITQSTTLSCFDVSQEDMDNDLRQLSSQCTITEAFNSEQEQPVAKEELVLPAVKETFTTPSSQTAVDRKGGRNATSTAVTSKDILTPKLEKKDDTERYKEDKGRVGSSTDKRKAQQEKRDLTGKHRQDEGRVGTSTEKKDTFGKHTQVKGKIESYVRFDDISTDTSANRLHSKLRHAGLSPRYVTLPRNQTKNAGFAFAVYDDVSLDDIKACVKKTFNSGSWRLVTKRDMNIALDNIGHGFRISESGTRDHLTKTKTKHVFNS